MATTLTAIERIEFRSRFGLARLDEQGDEHGDMLDQVVRGTDASAVVALDLRGVEYLGYSYAKRSLRRLLSSRNKGEYGERRFFIVADQVAGFFEGLEVALEQQNLFMLVCPSEDWSNDGRLIGDVPTYLQETFDVLVRTAPVATGSLAKLIDQSPQNTKNRLDRFYAMGLLRREKGVSPTGGLEWINRVF